MVTVLCFEQTCLFTKCRFDSIKPSSLFPFPIFHAFCLSSMSLLGATTSSDLTPVTLWVTQDYHDADNLSSLYGVFESAASLCFKGVPVTVFVECSTPLHDFSQPRYKGKGCEKIVLGIPPPEHYVHRDAEVLEDTRHAALVHRAFFRECLLRSSLAVYVRNGSASVRFVSGADCYTDQCVWQPIVPPMYLAFDTAAGRMLDWAGVSALADDLERRAWEEAAGGGDGTAVWAGLLPDVRDGTGLRTPVYDVVPGSTAGRAMQTLRRLTREHLLTMFSAMDFGLGEDFTLADALAELGRVTGRVFFFVCSGAGGAFRAYQTVRMREDVAVEGVATCMLSLDVRDNFMGKQFNEVLDPVHSTLLLRALQRDGVKTVCVPTQLCKAPLRFLDNQGVESAGAARDRVGGIATEWSSGGGDTLGFSLAGYQAIWNNAKGGPQAVFDPLVAFLFDGMLQDRLHETVSLKAVDIDITGALAKKFPVSGSVFIPGVFADSRAELPSGDETVSMSSPFLSDYGGKYLEYVGELYCW